MGPIDGTANEIGINGVDAKVRSRFRNSELKYLSSMNNANVTFAEII